MGHSLMVAPFSKNNRNNCDTVLQVRTCTLQIQGFQMLRKEVCPLFPSFLSMQSFPASLSTVQFFGFSFVFVGALFRLLMSSHPSAVGKICLTGQTWYPLLLQALLVALDIFGGRLAALVGECRRWMSATPGPQTFPCLPRLVNDVRWLLPSLCSCLHNCVFFLDILWVGG